MNAIKTLMLFFITAGGEIFGCYLTYLFVKKGHSAWILIPSALSLAVFAWLLTLHPAAAGRTYAAYGGVYVVVAIMWLWLIEKQAPDKWDVLGSIVTLIGMAIIVFMPRSLDR